MKRTTMKLTFVTALLAAAGSPTALAGGFTFTDFSSTDGLTINRSASVVDDNGTDPAPVLQLTRPSSNQIGSVFTTERFTITDFSTHFNFRINGTSDGFVLAFQRRGATAIGGGGGNLGFELMPAAVGSKNVGVEFDTWNNAQDTSNNHIGVDVTTTRSIETVDVADPFDDGSLWHAWIDYHDTTLEVRANKTGSRPSDPLLVTDIDLVDLLGGPDAHIGFTSATGGSTTPHYITSWSYRDNNMVPVPATGWMGVVLMTVMGGFRGARSLKWGRTA